MDTINRNILIALDQSENSIRATNYVGELLKGIADFRIFLLHIISLPKDDYFMNDDEKTRWISEKQGIGNAILDKCADILVRYGFKESSIEKSLIIKACISIGESILQEQIRLNCSTVVLGRRGISPKEEFIFGSTSNKILHTPKKCTVWIVE